MIMEDDTPCPNFLTKWRRFIKKSLMSK